MRNNWPETIDEAHEALRDQLDTTERQKESYREDLLAANWRVHASYNDGFDDGFASADDWTGQHEEAMAKHGWYRALCADGEPMLLGDRMEWANGTFTIHELKFTEGGCTTWDSEHGYTVHADECRHHHEPTVEDVLLELLNEAEHFHSLEEAQDAIAEYAKKLRLAGDGE